MLKDNRTNFQQPSIPKFFDLALYLYYRITLIKKMYLVKKKAVRGVASEKGKNCTFRDSVHA